MREVIIDNEILKREQEQVIALGALRKAVTHCTARPGK